VDAAAGRSARNIVVTTLAKIAAATGAMLDVRLVPRRLAMAKR
jgi:hypothetical protein